MFIGFTIFTWTTTGDGERESEIYTQIISGNHTTNYQLHANLLYALHSCSFTAQHSHNIGILHFAYIHIKYNKFIFICNVLFYFRTTRTHSHTRTHSDMDVGIFQSSDDGNISISILGFKPTREDNGKVLICRAINEVLKHSIKETTLKLNVYCKYFAYSMYIYSCGKRWALFQLNQI